MQIALHSVQSPLYMFFLFIPVRPINPPAIIYTPVHCGLRLSKKLPPPSKKNLNKQQKNQLHVHLHHDSELLDVHVHVHTVLCGMQCIENINSKGSGVAG